MPELTSTPPRTVPARRRELVLTPRGDDGHHVVKNPQTGGYYRLGEREAFLLARLDGRQTAEEVGAAYRDRFGEPLSEEDFQDFVILADAYGFLEPAGGAGESAGPAPDPAASPLAAPARPAAPARSRGSLLSWRLRLFDPDRLLARVEPGLRFLWTRGFLVVSAGTVLAAAVVFCLNWPVATRSVAGSLRWEVAALAWLTLLLVTMLHELAHGLTCKHYGGEVREIGFLLLLFMPCFYCNVSDAWLFRERSRRLWVTLAGGYCDLCVWAAAVFTWQLTEPGSPVHYLAWVVVSVSLVRVLFNFNPLLKLDGYYLLSDWLGIPNLRRRAWRRALARLGWAIGRGPRPDPEPWGRFLVVFGVASWLFSAAVLVVMVATLARWLGAHCGPAGAGAAVLLGLLLARALLRAVLSAGARKKLVVRRQRAATA